MAEDIELLLRILCDTLPARADAAYLYAQTEPNQESVCAAAKALLHARRTERILVSDCTPKSGYVGVDAYREALVRHGIPPERIENVPMEPTEILHTRVEAEAVVRFAKERRYQRVIVVSAPFHQERAFMTVVTVALREYPSLKVHSYPGKSQPWDEVVTHSQGELRGSRAEIIAEELKRIETYTAQGDLAPRANILKYLRNRDDE